MLTAEFWLANIGNSENIIANPREIAMLNQQILKKSKNFVCDLSQYLVEINVDQLCSLLDQHSFMAQKRYIGNRLVGDDYYKKLVTEINLSEAGKFALSYGFTVKRTSLRRLPTLDFVTNCPNDYEFDRLQETAITAVLPLVVLHVSRSQQWYFVQTYYGVGWVVAADVATTQNRQEWLEYFATERFLVVTGNRLRLSFNPYCPALSELEFYMGDKLPLVYEDIPCYVNRQSVAGNYVVKLPIQQENGQLAFHLALVPIVSDVCQGYLPYTSKNILTQAFKMQGDRYGWGGSFNSRDCSAFILDIYRSFGIHLPRNTREQMYTAGKTVDFLGKTAQERSKLLSELAPGAALYFPGHVMLYLGEDQGEYYVIHAIAECGDSKVWNKDDMSTTMPLFNIMVTPLSLLRTNGQSLFTSLVIGKLFQ